MYVCVYYKLLLIVLVHICSRICILTTHCNNMNSVYLKQQTAEDLYCQFVCRFAMSCHLRSPYTHIYIYTIIILFSFFLFASIRFIFDLFVCLSKSLSFEFFMCTNVFQCQQANVLEIRRRFYRLIEIVRKRDKFIS